MSSSLDSLRPFVRLQIEPEGMKKLNVRYVLSSHRFDGRMNDCRRITSLIDDAFFIKSIFFHRRIFQLFDNQGEPAHVAFRKFLHRLYVKIILYYQNSIRSDLKDNL